jgi:hypothetical protein
MPAEPHVPVLPDTPQPLTVLLARLEERVAALETSLAGQQAELEEERGDLVARQVDIDKVAWFVKHGRKRPW